MATELQALWTWLKRVGPETLGRTTLMPLVEGTKRPMYKHKEEDAWTCERADACVAANGSWTEWALLLDRLAVIDADNEAAVAALEAHARACGEATVAELLARCPMQLTKKGRHYFFLRPEWADEEGYWDGARQAPSGAELDLKTVTSSGTRGILAVAPSKNKSWAPGRAPWDEGVELAPMPRELMRFVATPKGKAVGPLEGPPSEAAAAAAAAAPPPREPAPTAQDPVKRLLLLLSKTRWEDRRMWRDIATALKNEHGEKYRAVWDELSRVSSKYEASEAAQTWATVARAEFEGPRLGMGTIHRWAREDDPIGYAELRATTIAPVVLENWDKEDYGLAAITRHLLKDRIKRTGIKTASVFFFDEDECMWRTGTEASLHKMITEALEEVLRDVEAYYGAKARSETDDAQRKMWDDKRRQVGERLRYIRRHGGISNVTAEALPLFQDDAFEQRLDSKPHLLGVENGVVDLRTGVLRQRTPEDMVFTVLKVRYDPTADTRDMEDMVLSCMAGDAEMAAFLQRLWGYAVTGEVCEEVFAVFTGSGRNGKGGMTQTIAKVMGDFFKSMNSGLICERQVSNVDAERGKLLGARIAMFDELKAGEKLKTHEVQLISGGDGIPARPLYKDPVTITPRHQAILATNHLPELTEVLPSMVLRLLIVHFPVTFTDLLEGERETQFRRQVDPTLKRRLEANLEGVLRWLVQGAVAWYAKPGLRKHAPAKVLEYSRQYFEEQDRLEAFLAQKCEVGEGKRVPTAALLGAFNGWLGDEGVSERWTDKTLAAGMRVKGFAKKKLRVEGVAANCFVGLKMKEGGEEDPEAAPRG